MNALRKRLAILCVAAIAVAAVIPTRAYTSFGKWATLSVLVYVNPQNLDVSQNAAEAAVLAAMDVWNTQGATPFRFVYGGRTSDSSVIQDGKNVVMFRNQNNGSVIATTYSWLFNGQLTENDIVFWDGGFTFFTGTTGCTGGGMYIEDVGTHELGHALGLGHSTDPQATMFSSVSACSQQLRTLAPDDIAGVQSLYGATHVNQPPSVSLTSPASGATFTAPASITMQANASDSDGTVTSVTFYVNGTSLGTDGSAPYSFTWNGAGVGDYTLTASATDNSGATQTSVAVPIHVVTGGSGTATATFVTRDTTTKGSWQGTYGRDGYVLASEGVSLPAGVTVTPAGKQDWVWDPSPVDLRALQRVSLPGRIAATWYGSTFTIDVTTGATPRRVGLYVVDWDTLSRIERIDVLDAGTGVVLDSRLLTGFAGGEYWTWDVAGAVRFRVTLTGGFNAVVSALFLDPAGGGGPVNQPPAVSVTSPAPGASFPAPASITVEADASDADGSVTGVTFYANGNPIGSDATAPYSVPWTGMGAGTYALTARATDDDGAAQTSAPVTIQVTAPPGSTTASFVGRDTTTKGNWQGTYGRDGYVLASEGVSLPAGVTVTPAGKQDWVWDPSPLDLRALQRASLPGRIAATWYGSTFTIDVSTGVTRRVGLYVVDWDTLSRIERIDVLDAGTGALLDSRLLTGFAGGEYWTWDVAGAVRFRVTLTGGFNAVVSALFLDPAGGPVNQPPSVSVTSPAPGASFPAPASITVEADASDADGSVTGVTFYANGNPIGSDATAPYSVPWTGMGAGTYALTARATDDDGAAQTSAPVTIQVTAPPGSTTASFVGRDTTTKGNWQGTYGRDGYVLASEGVSLPAGVTVTPAGKQDWVWDPSPLDLRALQRVSLPGRIAATWYGSTFTIDVSTGVTRRVGLYVVDWDTLSRIERIDVLDAGTGALLDSRLLTGFAGGEYWTWDVAGAVRFRVTLTGGFNAVVSAVFLDPAP